MSRALLIGLLAGALLRVAVIDSPGTPDVGTWKTWSFTAASDPLGLYDTGGDPPHRRVLRWGDITGTTEYLPLELYELGVVGRVYQRIDPPYRDSVWLTRLIKAPGLLSELALVVLLLTVGHRVLGEKASRWMAMAIWLNPAIILNGAALGYLDAQMAIPAVLSFVAVMAGAIAVAALVLLPIVWHGGWPNMVQAVGRAGSHDMLSGFAANVWWLVTWITRSAYAAPEVGWVEALTSPVRMLQIKRFVEIGFFNPQPIAAIVVLALTTWGCWGYRRSTSPATPAFVGGWSVLTYFVWNVPVHENHLYLAVPVLALAAALDSRYRLAFGVVSMLCALNMDLSYGLGESWPFIMGRWWSGVDFTVIVACVVCGVWLWLTLRPPVPRP